MMNSPSTRSRNLGLRFLLALVPCLYLLPSSRAAELAPSTPLLPPSAAGTNRVPFRRLDDGSLQIGKVRLDPRARTVSFPASVNMNEGIIEYLLVSTLGKTHESLFRTEAEPFHLQTAMLLLGAKGAGKPALTNAPAGGQLSAEDVIRASAAPLLGERVTIAVAWTHGGKTNECALEDFVFDARARTPMRRGPFVFTGSHVFQGLFLAQQEGSIIAVITDPGAVFNNPRPGRESEDNWRVITTALPPLDTPVRITITVPPPAALPASPPPPNPAPKP